MSIETLKWVDNSLVLLDQTLLPNHVEYKTYHEIEDIAEAIEQLVVRGAPAIGLTAAYAIAISAYKAKNQSSDFFLRSITKACDRLSQTRPTAVNLFWAIDKMQQIVTECNHLDNTAIYEALLNKAHELFEQDRLICRKMGSIGADLLPEKSRVITHCNAGALATADYGTALGMLYSAKDTGKSVTVYACETRPLLQGGRLTTWELQKNGIDVTIICDNMTASLLRHEDITCCVVGADRIAANGDVANKIGTYGLAILAKEHNVPFYIVAPISTLDLSIETGEHIPIERRHEDEVRRVMNNLITKKDVPVYNPSFDVTPYQYVSAIISEKGIARPPFSKTLRSWKMNEPLV
ncbi:MAG: S-methyl-5-thioribose-1-phosphate isomerase [Candidatus Latescibacterota bacterium]|nr:S-methyl-5-thioribose-1-phosphate isomerase [Candidatus Latescibacterota bacterium]